MLVYEDNPQRDVGTNIVYTWNKHWLYINNSSVHSVGVGADSSRPSIPNCIITPHITVGCTRTNIIYSWNKHWLRINNPQRTFRGHRVRFIAPVCTNCINTITHHSGCTWVNIGVRGQSQRTFRRRRGRLIAPVHTELYKCNYASQWVHVV